MQAGARSLLLARGLDPLFLVGELALRHVYWRSERWVAGLRRHRRSTRPARVLDRERLRERLEQLGVRAGGLVLVHSSIAHLAVPGPPGAPPVATPLSVAAQLLSDLTSLVGDDGTLAMPTHPEYAGDTPFLSDKSALVLEYAPHRNRSRVGLLTELFRRRPGVQRSLHPLSSLACRGPRAEELLRDNLNDREPLPHGEASPYHRFCRLDGTIVSIGAALIKSITCIHVAEELRDAEWPVPGFFYRRRFAVKDASGAERTWVVRERRPEFVRSLALEIVRRDLLREGILVETELGGVPIHAARSGALLEYMLHRNRASTYPYYLPGLARL